MNFLSRIEEILLIAIWKLGDNAYGTTILEQVEKDTGTTWLSGAVYGVLTRLLKNEYVEAKKEESKRDSVGRPRIYYKITETGLKKLTMLQEINRTLWEGMPNLKSAE